MSTVPAPPAPIPAHVAIIMDGNGRWANQRGLPRLAGHHAGAQTVRRIVTYARRIGVRYLTLYAFSSENWRRPRLEVNGLMQLLQAHLRSELRTMVENGIALRVIGDAALLPGFVRDALQETCDATADLEGMTLTLALSYGGRDEILRAVQRVAREVAAGTLTPDAVDAATFARHLDTADMPDPDVLIRTSGEQRISNFLLWQIAYSELMLLPVFWPDFSEQHLHDAIVAYQQRERRFGMTGEQTRQAVELGEAP